MKFNYISEQNKNGCDSLLSLKYLSTLIYLLNVQYWIGIILISQAFLNMYKSANSSTFKN